MSFPIPPGGLAAVLAHPDDESFGCAGALALAHEAGATTRLLVVTRGEAGTSDGMPDAAFGVRARLSSSARPAPSAWTRSRSWTAIPMAASRTSRSRRSWTRSPPGLPTGARRR